MTNIINVLLIDNATHTLLILHTIHARDPPPRRPRINSPWYTGFEISFPFHTYISITFTIARTPHRMMQQKSVTNLSQVHILLSFWAHNNNSTEIIVRLVGPPGAKLLSIAG